MISPVILSIIIHDTITTNKEVNESSQATLKPSSWDKGFNYSTNVNTNYDWIEINETGTEITNWDNSDNGAQGLNLTDIGFTDFKFFGRVYEYLNVCTNGWMTFSFDGDPTSYRFNFIQGRNLAYIPQDCNDPNKGSFNSSIFLFGCDLYPGGSDGGVYYEVKGTSPNRLLIIEYYWIEEHDTDRNQTIQVIFYEQGNIKFQYKKTSDIAGFRYGKYPTVGLDNGDLINYNNVLIDLLNFSNGVEEKAIFFRLNAPHSTPLPTPDDDGDDGDDGDGVDMGLVIIVIVLVSIGAGVAVIIVLIKKGIIRIHKYREKEP